MNLTKIKTSCSGCFGTVLLDTDAATAAIKVPSNGKRGSLHVPAYVAKADLSGDDDLLLWDCPSCGYADSFDLNN